MNTTVTARQRLGCLASLARRIWCALRHQRHYVYKTGFYYDQVVCSKCHIHW